MNVTLPVLVDVGVGKAVENWLHNAGYDIKAVRDVDPRGVLLLRLEDARSDEKVRVVEEIFTKYGDQLAGHFSVYQDGRLRIR